MPTRKSPLGTLDQLPSALASGFSHLFSVLQQKPQSKTQGAVEAVRPGSSHRAQLGQNHDSSSEWLGKGMLRVWNQLERTPPLGVALAGLGDTGSFEDLSTHSRLQAARGSPQGLLPQGASANPNPGVPPCRGPSASRGTVSCPCQPWVQQLSDRKGQGKGKQDKYNPLGKKEGC